MMTARLPMDPEVRADADAWTAAHDRFRATLAKLDGLWKNPANRDANGKPNAAIPAVAAAQAECRAASDELHRLDLELARRRAARRLSRAA